jgi:hypothetical protein
MTAQDLQSKTMTNSQIASRRGRENELRSNHIGPRLALFESMGRALVSILLLLALGSLIAGCGGGGSHTGNPNPNPNPNGSNTLLSGTVTDVNGSPIVGANVTFNGQTVTSTQFGTYTIPNVVVPAGQTSLVGAVQATKTINGASWSGQNIVEALSGEPDTSNVHIVMSPSASQNAITGTVTDTSGHVLRGARVFASIGPFTGTGGGQFFSNLSSIGTTTDQNGTYTLAQLPPGSNYTVTASFAGFLNQTFSNISVNAPPAAVTVQPFQLATSSSSPTPPIVTGLSALAVTSPAVPTRSAGGTSSSRGLNAIKAWIFAKKGLSRHHAAASKSVTLKKKPTRDTPAGSIIEADLFWDYENINNLFGYEVAQATNLNPPNFISIALIRDPLADRFSDVDLGLTPDITYYYSIARLDTINFPSGNINAGEGPPTDAVAIQPLGPINLVSPASGAVTATKTPLLTWTAVNRATLYQVLVYDRFPDLQSDTDTVNGVQPIWPVDPRVPNPSQVMAPATSQTYQGPALVSGHTYFWAVLAQDDAGSAFSVSPIQSFVAP